MDADQAAPIQEVHDDPAPARHFGLAKRVRMRGLEALNCWVLSAVRTRVTKAEKNVRNGGTGEGRKGEVRDLPPPDVWKPRTRKGVNAEERKQEPCDPDNTRVKQSCR